MGIQAATGQDIRAMAEVAAASFMDDDLFGELMHPHRAQYPEDFIQYFETSIRSHFLDIGYHHIVWRDQDSDAVTGLAIWKRNPPTEDGSMQPPKDEQQVVPPAASVSRNRAADETKAKILEETFPLFSHHWSGAREQNWSLEMLATDPGFRFRGIGRELVLWGTGRAEKDGLCSTVISSRDGAAFYEKLGFVEVGRANVGPLKAHGIQGGAIMFRETRQTN